MSTAELTAIKGGKKELHLVEAFRRQNADLWDVADALLDDIRERADEDTVAAILVGNSKPTGLTEVLIDVLHEARKEGVDLKTSTATIYLRTALAWTPQVRTQGVSFAVHARLRAKPDRVALMNRWVKKFGTVTEADALRELSEGKPKKTLTFLDGIEQAVRSVLQSHGKPWTHVAQGDRDEIARRLHVIGNEIINAEGKFGR